MKEQSKSKPSKSKKKMVVIITSVILGLAVVGSGIFYHQNMDDKEDDKKEEEKKVEKQQTYKVVSDSSSRFAKYDEIKVNVNNPQFDYIVESGLSNVTNKSDFKLSKEAEDLLEDNAFVVAPGWRKEYFSLYENNRYEYTPSFITTDSVLHNYHLLFEYILERTEKEELLPELKNLNKLMSGDAKSQYEETKGSSWENAALRNLGFFTVGSKLVDDTVEIPEDVAEEVEEELSLIKEHKGITLSPLMNIGTVSDALEGLKEDYTQYIPRGHYDRTEEMKQYFKSMMWYGRLTFRFKNEDEVKSAMLISLALSKDENKTSWDRIYEPTNFFVGKSDDVTFYEMIDLMEQVYGEDLDLKMLVDETEKFQEFLKALDEIAPPQINSIPVYNSAIQPDRDREVLGFRFMGQRYTIDADIFQRLLDREVPERMLPKGLDIPSAMGSEEAYNILKEEGATDFANYPENMQKMKDYTAGLSEDIWTQNLYWGWMNSLNVLTEKRGEGYPMFMQTQAWSRKDMNTYLGSWTELKHDTILYAKQAYAEMGSGGGPKEKDDRGYVEPNPWLFARIVSLLQMTENGLESRDLLSERMEENLSNMKELVMKLKIIAEKELNQEKITEEEYELIRSYGGQLEHLWNEVNAERAEDSGMPLGAYLDENPAALVADVATDPNGTVLEEGTGNIYEIFVIVPIDGELRITKGGVYSHYEFVWPMDDRLTDKKWREMLGTEKEPEMEQWKKSYMVEDNIRVIVETVDY